MRQIRVFDTVLKRWFWDDAPTEGGGSLPGDENWAEYNGAITNVAATNSAYLHLTDLGDGTELLDLSTPDTPSVLTAGVYAMTTMLRGVSVPDVAVEGIFHLDHENKDAVAWMNGRGDGTFPDVLMSGSCTVYIPEGGTIKLQAFNFGDDPLDMKWDELIVQKLS